MTRRAYMKLRRKQRDLYKKMLIRLITKLKTGKNFNVYSIANIVDSLFGRMAPPKMSYFDEITLTPRIIKGIVKEVIAETGFLSCLRYTNSPRKRLTEIYRICREKTAKR